MCLAKMFHAIENVCRTWLAEAYEARLVASWGALLFAEFISIVICPVTGDFLLWFAVA